MTKNTGGPAFPMPEFSIGHAKYQSREAGMTLRDYFAAKAMQAEIANHPPSYWRSNGNYTFLSRYAYRMADAMLKEREK